MTETVFNSRTTTDHRVNISQVFIYYMTFVCLQYYFLERKKHWTCFRNSDRQTLAVTSVCTIAVTSVCTIAVTSVSTIAVTSVCTLAVTSVCTIAVTSVCTLAVTSVCTICISLWRMFRDV